MNKGDLVNEVAKVVSTKKEAQAAVDCVFSSITKALKKKGAVTLVGFGTFKAEKGEFRNGKNLKYCLIISVDSINGKEVISRFAPEAVSGLQTEINRGVMSYYLFVINKTTQGVILCNQKQKPLKMFLPM